MYTQAQNIFLNLHNIKKWFTSNLTSASVTYRDEKLHTEAIIYIQRQPVTYRDNQLHTEIISYIQSSSVTYKDNELHTKTTSYIQR